MTQKSSTTTASKLAQVEIVCGRNLNCGRGVPHRARPILDPTKRGESEEDACSKRKVMMKDLDSETTKRPSRAEDYRHFVAAQDAMTSFAPSSSESPDKPSESRAIRCFSLHAACRCQAIRCLLQEHGQPIILHYNCAPHPLASRPYLYSRNATRE